MRVSPPQRQLGQMKRIANVLKAQPQITQVRTNVQNGSIVINFDRDIASLDKVSAALEYLGIVFGERKQGKSEAATYLTNAAFGLNKRVEQATSGKVDLRFLLPLGFSTLALRQLLTKGLQFETIPWYVLAWYAFDSFIKLHYTSED